MPAGARTGLAFGSRRGDGASDRSAGTSSIVRIQIVAEIRLYREGLSQMLGQRDGFAVVGATPNRPLTIAALQELKPNIVLLDMATYECDAIIRDVKQLAPEIPIVAIAIADVEDEVLSCIEAGVAGYVGRDGSLDDLVDVVSSAARGELRCSPRIAGRLVKRVAALAAGYDSDPAQGRLTAREREVVHLIEQNLSNKEIATRLGIEVATVKNHVHNLLEKLKVHRRADAARRLAMRMTPAYRSKAG